MVKKKQKQTIEFDFEDGWMVIYYKNKKYQTDLPDFMREEFANFIKPLTIEKFFEKFLSRKGVKKEIEIPIDDNKKVVVSLYKHNV